MDLIKSKTKPPSTMLQLRDKVEFFYDGRKIDKGIVIGRSFNHPEKARYDLVMEKDGKVIENVPAANLRKIAVLSTV